MRFTCAPPPPDQAARYRREGYWKPAPLGYAFERTCERHPLKDALFDGSRRVTFSEWERLTRRVASGFRVLGVAPGDVVAYQLPNWWEAAVIFVAAARIGAVVIPLLPMFRERELRFILEQSRARLLIIPGRFRGFDYPGLLTTLWSGLPHLAHVLVARGEPPVGMQAFAEFLATPWDQQHPETALYLLPGIDPDQLLMVMYTSGTTADPKGVLHTHNTLGAEVRSLERVHDLRPADITLVPSPVTHISGVIHGILIPALVGTTAVFMDRWDAAEALSLIHRKRVTYMVGAPTFLRDLVDHPAGPGLNLECLRLFSCGGAEVSPDLIRRARQRLGCIAKRVYGSTEFPTVTTTDATDAEHMGAETEGRAIWPAEVRVVDEAGQRVPPGVEGEIQARGPECFVGYADAALNAEAFTADGWFRTGDLGSLDANGYLRVTGRIKEIVIRKGEKFSVRELEELIAQHAAVAEVAVVALPDPDTGERACAAVALQPGATLTLGDLTAFLSAAGLARQKFPTQLTVVARLPRTESGKVHRAALKRLVLASDSPATA